jgi:RNA polymerase sigma factor (sigma-70 family)
LGQTEEYTDDELLEKFADERTKNYAFNLLVQKFQKQVYFQSRRMVNDHEDADDVVQEVFIKVWKNLHKFRADAQLSTWIYRIAVNECLKFIKKKKSKSHVSYDDVAYQMEGERTTSHDYSGKEIQRLLQAAIATLPDKQKLVFNMKYFDEMKYEEMSGILGTSVGALKASYHLAVKKIQSNLKGKLNH